MKKVKTKSDIKPMEEYFIVWAKLNMTIEKPIKQMAIDDVMKFTRNDILKITLISLEYLENKSEKKKVHFH